MRRVLSLILPLIFAIAGTLAMSSSANAASSGVQDKGHLFSDDAVTKANSIIRQINTSDDRDVLIVTFATIPDDLKEQFKSQSEPHFYETWLEDITNEKGASGVVMLLTKEPGHLQIAVGNKTRQTSFTDGDRDRLKTKMLSLLHAKRNDEALLQGVAFIKDTMRPNPSSAARTNNAPARSGWAGSSDSIPPSPTTNYPTHNITPSSNGFPIMGLICTGIIILAVVFIIMKLVNRNQSYGGGYNAPPPGGYPPGYSGGGYPQGGGYGYGGGGGGGGFGRGLLGGLLGGALGAWGYERFNQGSSSNPNYIPPQTGGNPGGGNYGNSNDQTDTSFSGTGGDFGSSTDSNAGSGGADFGSSADSGTSGSDFGSSDSSGGGSDFGSSGGDFGGGGDSGGGGSGGDF